MVSAGRACGPRCSLRATSRASGQHEGHAAASSQAPGGIDPLRLRAGDYVVHEQHRVGRYVEMTSRTVHGATREYVVIEYAPASRPAARRSTCPPTSLTRSPGMSAVRHQRCTGSAARLGEDEGACAQGGPPDRRRADPAVLGAYRVPWARVRPGHPVATRARGRLPLRGDPDQLAAIDKVKADMERQVPMAG